MSLRNPFLRNIVAERAKMSGDSQNSDKFFELKEHVPPTAVTAATINASVLVEPTPRKIGTDIPPAEPSTTNLRSTTLTDVTDEEAIEAIDTPLTDRKDTANRNIPNGSIEGDDSLDGDMKIEEDDEEDEDCGIKCLYYTMQCCECTVM